jgi:hypothetical protein
MTAGKRQPNVASRLKIEIVLQLSRPSEDSCMMK